MDEIKIKVRPEPYRTRAGEKVFVTGLNEHPSFPFDCSDRVARSRKGSVWLRRSEDDRDIIGDWEEPSAPASSPDRMQVWLRFVFAYMNSALCEGIKRPSDVVRFADELLAEYERRKGGGK